MSRDPQEIIRHARLLGDLLASDVQDYRPRIDEIAAALAALRAPGHAAHHGFSGNVYRLTLTAAHATIANKQDHAVAPETIALDDFECAFRAWAVAHGAP